MFDIHFFINFFSKFNEYIQENKDYLTELDSAIGDADHGINMSKGCKVALEKIENSNFKSVSDLLKSISMALMSSVGGASGPLYGTIFMRMAVSLSMTDIELKNLSSALQNALNGIKSLGKAELGDKTMVDVWEPVVNEFNMLVEKNTDIFDLKNKIISLAEKSMKNTTPLIARKGRASYLGPRSANHQDPGATSSYLFFKALFESLE
ncbi:MAG: dihydroxyacetone kinase subunit DhaL [Desulfurella sp.]|uniref:dihydroxyacetone kinase subunit DhaL n=1 Tax=Desulfurella sp. TaxID=1962857 RepID=UPI003CACC09E